MPLMPNVVAARGRSSSSNDGKESVGASVPAIPPMTSVTNSQENADMIRCVESRSRRL